MTETNTREGNTSMSIRDLSYKRRVERGGTVTFRAQTATSDHNGEHRLEIGQVYTGTVLSESNAGFAGIVMTVEIDGGRYVGISTGTIEANETMTTITYHEYWSEVTALGDAVAQELQSRHPASYDAHDELIAAVDGHEWSFLAEPFLADVTESYWNRFDESGERLADCDASDRP